MTRREPVGQRLRRLRVAAGLSQRGLEVEGVSYAYISRIESGSRVPSAKALRKLAPQLGVTALYLETGSDEVVCPQCLRPSIPPIEPRRCEEKEDAQCVV